MRKSKELALHELTPHFDMGRTAVSKHLTILKDAGLVWSKKVGKETRYRINPNPLKVVNDWVGFYEEFWLSRLEKLEEV